MVKFGLPSSDYVLKLVPQGSLWKQNVMCHYPASLALMMVILEIYIGKSLRASWEQKTEHVFVPYSVVRISKYVLINTNLITYHLFRLPCLFQFKCTSFFFTIVVHCITAPNRYPPPYGYNNQNKNVVQEKHYHSFNNSHSLSADVCVHTLTVLHTVILQLHLHHHWSK